MSMKRILFKGILIIINYFVTNVQNNFQITKLVKIIIFEI
jgi:hypothetical protein